MAVHKEDTEWVVEAAIPLAALTGDGVTPGRAWCCNVIRTVPGRGVQAWSLPAEAPEEAMRPEGMGLLIFTQDGKAAPAALGAAATVKGRPQTPRKSKPPNRSSSPRPAANDARRRHPVSNFPRRPA